MSTTKQEYSRVGNEDLEEEIGRSIPRRNRFSPLRVSVYVAGVLFLILVSTSALAFLPPRKALRNGRWDPQILIPSIPSSTVAFHMADKWVRYDDEGNEAWDHLIPVRFGLVAVEGPSNYDLQTGHIDPATDGSEAWFGLSVFHQLHCLRALRDLVREQKIGVPSRHWGGPDHLEHCLNMIRQGIMCSADTTLEWPLYVKEGFGSDGPITGEGITHECKNWDSVMNFAVTNGDPINSTVKRIPL